MHTTSTGTGSPPYFQPSPGLRIGIRGGPILHPEIHDELPRLSRDRDRYVAFVSLLAPSSQKLAAAVFWAGAAESVTVVEVARGRRFRQDATGSLHLDALGRDAERLQRVLHAAAGVRLPALVDTATGRVSNNVYALPWRLATQLATPAQRFAAVAAESTHAAAERVAREERLFTDLHAGVYRAGFLTEQDEYDEQVAATGALLGELDARLGRHPYLSGERPGLDDLWAFTLIVRFDHVYGPLFRLHRYRVTDFPALLDWARRLYADPVLRATSDFDAITAGYYGGIPALRREILPQGVRDRHLLR